MLKCQRDTIIIVLKYRRDKIIKIELEQLIFQVETHRYHLRLGEVRKSEVYTKIRRRYEHEFYI